MRQIDVIYCDDIREEIGNKVSYMGIYAGELRVPGAPVLLGKLCIAVRIHAPIGRPIESLEVRVVKEKMGVEIGEVLATGVIEHPADFAIDDEAATKVLMQLHFMLQPFQIEDSFEIRVKAKTESEELVSGALRIRVDGAVGTEKQA